MSDDLLKAATNAGAVIGAIYDWLHRVEQAGGATSTEGIAVCHAMLKSLRKNAGRTEALVMAPLREAIALAKSGGVGGSKPSASTSLPATFGSVKNVPSGSDEPTRSIL